MKRSRYALGPPPARVPVLLTVLFVLLGGASAPTVPRGGWLSYVVVADRADAEGAGAAVAAVRAAGGVTGPVHPQIGVVVGYAAQEAFAARVRAAPGVQVVGAARTAPMAVPPAVRSPARPSGPPPLPRAGSAAGTGEAGERGQEGSRRQDDRAGASAAERHSGGVRDSREGARGPSERARASSEGARRSRGGDEDRPPLVADPRERIPWNLSMIGADRPAPAALRDTVVAVLDSGVDDTHPDLRAAVDPERSASCADGSPDTAPGAWRPLPFLPDNGHGTHIAGTVAAARDGRGVTGVAPGARIAAVRLLGPSGQYYPENIVCGFLWAADHGARVINNSYFADPWKYNCPRDPDQAAVIAAITRAVAYAQSRGALVVASAGNDGQDLGAARVDRRSPNDHRAGATPPARRLGADCIRLPGGLPGVLGVTAVDRGGAPAAYSNHHAGRGWLAAPGGDPAAGPEGQIVSTWPGGRYAALSGTSMAAAHVSAAAAVEAALHPDAPPDRVHAVLSRTAARRSCPDTACAPDPAPGRDLLSLRGIR